VTAILLAARLVPAPSQPTHGRGTPLDITMMMSNTGSQL
jgi:hypothetical protein